MSLLHNDPPSAVPLRRMLQQRFRCFSIAHVTDPQGFKLLQTFGSLQACMEEIAAAASIVALNMFHYCPDQSSIAY